MALILCRFVLALAARIAPRRAQARCDAGQSRAEIPAAKPCKQFEPQWAAITYDSLL